MISTVQRRFAPMVIGIDWNPDRHQIGISDRHRWNLLKGFDDMVCGYERVTFAILEGFSMKRRLRRVLAPRAPHAPSAPESRANEKLGP